MKKKLNVISKNNKKQRGVAVIFTLGILGLLTVMALGFASTALLNNSLSKNVMNNAYARGLAKNLALTQALYIIKQKEIDGGFVDYRNVYTWGTDTNSTNHKDFLWKLDYSDADVQMFKYEPDKTANNPANNVRWQYVKDSNNKLIGRYAYVVIPDKGRIDPSVNLGRDDTLDSMSIKEMENRVPLGISAGSLADAYTNKFRWMTYREIIKKASISNAFYTFEYDGISPSLTMKSPEAFWKGGKLYSRFNMNRPSSYWESITPEDLCGVGKTLAEFPVEQQFIPWLKDMYDNSSTQPQALQIAANIIQYNQAFDKPTVTDQPDADDTTWSWLTAPPSYAGIGRHPMLNEIGFLVRVRAEVIPEFVSKDDEAGTITYKYQPLYYITFDAGAELIYPFGSASGMKDSEIRFSQMTMQFKLRKFLKSGKSPDPQTTANNLGSNLIVNGILNAQMLHSDLDRIKIQIPGSGADRIATVEKLITESSTEITLMGSAEGEGFGWTNLDLSLQPGDWNTSPAYTLASKFWKEGQTGNQQTVKMKIRTIQLTTSTSLGTADEIAAAMARRMTIEWETPFTTPATVVLKYDGKQRDVARLETKQLPSNMTDFAPEKVWLISYEAKDPLVNHSQNDWKVSTIGPKDWSETTSLTNDYPGTCIREDGKEKHVNNPFKEILAAGETDPVKILLKNFGYGSSDGDPNDPAYMEGISRLPTSFIKHGQMLSFWELGCISRGKLFENLNLLLRDQDKSGSYTPDYTRAKGDAVLFDQLKFTNENYSDGKINLNTDIHKVLEQLFLSVGTAGKQLTFKKDIHKSSGDDLLSAGIDSASSVKIFQSTLERYKEGKLHSLDTEPESECLACQLKKIMAKPYQIQNRADLLSTQSNLPVVTNCADPTTGSAWAEWTKMQELLLSGATYLEKIQLVSKLMPLLRTAPADTLRVIILAQSIRDVGGDVPVLVDWYGKGVDSDLSTASDDEKKKAMFKAGYRRSITGNKLVSTESEGVWKEPEFNGDDDSAGSKAIRNTYTKNAIGTYDLGRDKITGETKLVATLVRDPVKKTWKLVRMQYVE